MTTVLVLAMIAGAAGLYLFMRQEKAMADLPPIPTGYYDPIKLPGATTPDSGLKGQRLTDRELDFLSIKWARTYSILKPAEIKAIIMVESSGYVQAENPADPSWGLMQVTALIGNFYGDGGTKEHLFNIESNLKAGAGFLADLKGKYAARYPLSDPRNGWVQMYNTGEPKFLSRGVRVPEYQAKFMEFLAQFRSTLK